MKKITNRRDFLIKTTMAGIAGLALPTTLKAFSEEGTSNEILESPLTLEEPFSVPALPYGYDALEPHIDKLTMEIHHDKHHKAYVDNLNKAVKENNITGTLEDIIKNVSKYPVTVRNNSGGHWNHSFFWKGMKPGGGGAPSGKLADAINGSFESFEKFKTVLNEAAMKRFGSGWAWLIARNGRLEVGSTPNQDNPLMSVSDIMGTPIMGIDVWEHAYYLKYQNKRADYVNSWWNLVNWDQIAENFSKI